MRVKSKWSKKDKTHSAEEIGGALAFIAWRIGQNILLDLENNDFQTDTQLQRLNIIEEFLAFTIHMIDRMTIDKFTGEDRQRFMTELVMKTAKHMEDNKRDIVGPGDYKQAYIDRVNERMNDYADFKYDEEFGGPSFPMRRFFGDRVAEQMGEKNRKWVADQMLEVEAPEIMDALRKAVPNLFM